MVPHCVERRVPEAVVTEKKDLIENAIQQAVVMERHRAADVQVENMVPHCVERRVPEAAVTEKKDLREIVLQQAVEMGLRAHLAKIAVHTAESIVEVPQASHEATFSGVSVCGHPTVTAVEVQEPVCEIREKTIPCISTEVIERAADVQVENMVPHCVERRVPEAAVTEKKDLREIVLQQAVEMGLSTPWGDTVAGPHIPCITTWDDFVAGPWFPDYIPCLSPAQRRAVTAQCDEVGVPLTRAVCAGGPTGDS